MKFLKYLFTKHSKQITDKIKYYMFIVLYPIVILNGTLGFFINYEDMTLCLKIAAFLFVVIAFPILFRFSAVLSYFKPQRLNTVLATKKKRGIHKLFGPIGNTNLAKIIYVVGVLVIITFFLGGIVSAILDKEFFGIPIDMMITFIWIVFFRAKYKKYFIDYDYE